MARWPACSTSALVIVTGKGGVGKSTVALALGLAAAATGQAHDRLRGLLPGAPLRVSSTAAEVGFHEVEMADEPVGDLDRPRRVDARVRAAPAQGQGDARPALPLADLHLPGRRDAGPQELVTIGKIWELALDDRKVSGAQRYDLVIVDAPATGHGVGLPADAADVREHRPGRADPPAGRDARPRSSATASAPASRSSRCPRRCRSTRRRCSSATSPRRSASRSTAIFCNGLYPERFASARRSGSRRRAGGATGAARSACRAALSQSRRARAQREQLARLEETARPRSRPCPSCSPSRARGRASVDALADAMRGLMPGVAELLEGKRVCICAGLGRGRQDDHLGGDRGRDGGAGQEGRGADDRPGASGSPTRSACPSSATSSARSTRRCSPAPASTPATASSGR